MHSIAWRVVWAGVYRWSAQDGAVRVYMGFSYIEYSITNIIPFYYITEVLNLRPYYFTVETRYSCQRCLLCMEHW